MVKSNQSTTKLLIPIFKQFLPFARQDRLFILFLVITILAITITNTALIWLLGQPVNLLQEAQYDEIYTTLGLLAGVLIVNQLLHFIARVMSNRLGLGFVGRVRTQVLNKLTFLSFPGASRYQKGDLLARISNDVDQVEDLIVEVPIGLVSHFFTLFLYTSMILWIDLKLAIVAAFFLPIYYLHQLFFAPRKGAVAQRFFKKNGELLGFEEQTLGNLRGISSFGVESLINKRHSEAYHKARRMAMKMRTIDAAYDATFNLITYCCGILVVLAGISGVKQGNFSVGQLVSFLLYLGYISVPVRGFAQAPIQWRGDFGAAHRVTELLVQESIVPQNSQAQILTVKRGSIQFSNVCFSYTANSALFNHMDLKIAAGETLALVGPSGSGKTTFARLLMRFYDPQSGQIFIDDIDIKQVSLESLRKNIAVVWQDPFLISGSIKQNLCLAKDDATEEQIVAACKASYAWDFIQALDEGLETVIGEGAHNLSVGQRQRLSIAQAFLRDAPILILDEASSSLDSQSEQAIVNAVNDLRHDRTTLIIAHRYSSLRMADRVLYLNGDGTVMMDTHESLLTKHIDYKAAVEWQTRVSN